MNNRKIKLNSNRKSTVPKFGWANRILQVKKTHVIIVILVLSAVMLEMFNIFLTNRMDTDSIIASQLQKEVAIITQENNIVRAKVYELSSYESVASRAAEFGFKESGNILTLDTPIQVARQ